MMQAVFNPPEMHFTWSHTRNQRSPWRVEGEHSFVLLNRDGRPQLRMDIADQQDMDLGSVPWIFGWLFPANGWHLRGFGFHDGEYRTQKVARVVADFGMRMIHAVDRPRSTKFEDAFTFVQMWLLWFIVRVFGRKPWNQNAEAIARSENG